MYRVNTMINHILGNLCAIETNSDLHFFLSLISEECYISLYQLVNVEVKIENENFVLFSVQHLSSF